MFQEYVKLDSNTPPPLHYSPLIAGDRGRESTAESTPVGTPRTQCVSSPLSRRPEKEKDLYFSWHKKVPGPEGNSSSAFLESDLLYPDSGVADCSRFTLFPEQTAQSPGDAMVTQSIPLDISPPSLYRSASPTSRKSYLTSGLKEAGTINDVPSARSSGKAEIDKGSIFGRNESVPMSINNSYCTEARPISVNDRARRESNSGSLMTGISWGGVSVGSLVRDELIMSGSSPFLHQSPSIHSSSYIPKMEANFMRDFSCCGKTLDSLHDLIQHYEESHAPLGQNSSTSQPNPEASKTGPGLAGGATTSERHQQDAPATASGSRNGPAPTIRPFRTQQRDIQNDVADRQSSINQDMDPIGDMEIDDPTPEPSSGSSQFGPSSNRVAPLNVNIANTLQHKGLRNSSPDTPVTAVPTISFQHNPTVSSVNTPTLQTHSIQGIQNKSSPDSSVPGTPGEMDHDLSRGYILPVQTGNRMAMNSMDWSTMNIANGQQMADLCIDEPAKRLFSREGQLPQYLSNGQFMGNHMPDRLQEQQILAGMCGMASTYSAEDGKPFKCPVIGCEKAYKNQNGLKYHKQHGHQNQQLQENDDGTYSIVDPLTSIPYPGTVGMEKEKPYRCDFCGKRYKNLNGLKYHKQHSPPCYTAVKSSAMQPINPTFAMTGAGLVGLSSETAIY